MAKNTLNMRLLHVDKSSRQKYAESFFAGDVTFPFAYAAEHFLDVVDPEITVLVKSIRVSERNRKMRLVKGVGQPFAKWRYYYYSWDAVSTKV